MKIVGVLFYVKLFFEKSWFEIIGFAIFFGYKSKNFSYLKFPENMILCICSMSLKGIHKTLQILINYYWTNWIGPFCTNYVFFLVPLLEKCVLNLNTNGHISKQNCNFLQAKLGGMAHSATFEVNFWDPASGRKVIIIQYFALISNLKSELENLRCYFLLPSLFSNATL